MTAPKSTTPKLSPRQIRAFHNRYIKGSPDECWPWQGGKNPDGYGIVHAAKPSLECYLAHRIAFWLHYGYWPAQCVLHDCDFTSCVNWNHLYEGTRKKNNEDRDTRGRAALGERHGKVKLTRTDVREIRKALADGEYPTSISRRYNVSVSPIKGIRDGKTWKWLDSTNQTGSPNSSHC